MRSAPTLFCVAAVLAVAWPAATRESLGPKYYRRDGKYVRVPYGTLANPCAANLPVTEGRVRLYQSRRDDHSLVGKALEDSFYLWREYPCEKGRIHGTAHEFRGGKVVESVPYRKGIVHGIKTVYYADGKVKETLEFRDGRREGRYRKLDPQGATLISARYDDNKLHGEAQYVDPARGVTVTHRYDEGERQGEPGYSGDNVQEAFLLAAGGGHLNEVKRLLEKGFPSGRPSLDGYGEKRITADTALHAAVRYGRTEVVDFLLSRGADPNRLDANQLRTPLMEAVEAKRGELIRRLLAAGAKPGLANLHGDTALHTAVRMNRPELVAVLLEAGAPVEAKNRSGMTPLELARRQDAMEVLLLLQKRTEAERGGKGAGTVSDAACTEGADWLSGFLEEGRTEKVEAYLQRCGDEAEAVARMAPAFLKAVELGQARFVEEFLRRGVSPDGRGGEARDGALHRAVAHGRHDVLTLLLRHGVEVDMRDGQGRTALHRAAELGDSRSARLLVEAGASPELPSPSGKTALEILEERGEKALAGELRETAKTRQPARAP